MVGSLDEWTEASFQQGGPVPRAVLPACLCADLLLSRLIALHVGSAGDSPPCPCGQRSLVSVYT